MGKDLRFESGKGSLNGLDGEGGKDQVLEFVLNGVFQGFGAAGAGITGSLEFDQDAIALHIVELHIAAIGD